MMTYSEELAKAQQHLALALTFTDNNPLKATVIASATESIRYCTHKIEQYEKRQKLEAEHAASVAAYNALPFLKRLFTSNPSH